MTTAVAVREQVQSVIEIMERPEYRAQLQELLGDQAKLERFVRTSKLALQYQPELVQVKDKQSIFLALLRCAQDGLLPDGREAALVKVKDGVAYWSMVGGIRKIAARHGFSIEAHAVYANDQFEWTLGFEPSVVHVPPALGHDRGTLSGAYAVATGPDGRKYLEVMSRGEIEAIRAQSAAYKAGFGPWKTAEGEMYRKTVARRVFKQLPLADLDEVEARVAFPSEDEVEVATSPVPALAALPLPDEDIPFGDNEPIEGQQVIE